MNEQNQKLVSQKRFPEFRDDKEWELSQFSEVYNFHTTNSYSRDMLNYEIGTVKNIHYGDIHTKFQTLFDITKETVPFINPSESLDKIKPASYCVEGDMIFADASEDLADVGKSIEIVNLNNEQLLSGLHTLLARQKDNKLVIGFGGHLFKSSGIRKQIQKESQGAKVLGISGGRLSGIKVYFPSDKKEQQKIADCLSSLDDLITAQSQKVEALKQHKKGLMQQLFPAEGEAIPKLRFPEFENYGEWAFLHGDKIFEPISNKKHKSDLPILAISQEHGAIPREMIDYKVIATEQSIESYKVVDVGDFIISLRSFQGGIEYSNYKGICSPAYIILRNKIEVFDLFFKYYFKTDLFIRDLNKNIEGIRDGKMVSFSQFSEKLIPLPGYDEQAKIANCLFSIDDSITIETNKLQALKKHKKGLMQQLFPSIVEVTA